MTRPRALVSWSSGKDSAFALHVIQQANEYEIVGLITTVTIDYDRVAMHGSRVELLQLQCDALGLPCHRVWLPSPCSNEIYESKMATALNEAKNQGVSHVIFGDLFLADLREYREDCLRAIGLHAIFPLWMRDTRQLAEEMIRSGIVAHLTCVDPRQLDRSFAGRPFDDPLLTDLPHNVDPCGENGEFHTFVSDGPMFKEAILVENGPVVERDGFIFADLLPQP